MMSRAQGLAVVASLPLLMAACGPLPEGDLAGSPGTGWTSDGGPAGPGGQGPIGIGPGGGTSSPDAGEGPVTYAHEWVVSTTGDDAASGTAAAPFRTISRALAMAGPGDRITVRAGTYAERVLINGAVRHGTATARIVLEGEGRPRLVPPVAEALVLIERAYWDVRGFELDLQDRPTYAVAFLGETTGSRLVDNELHHGTFNAGVSVHGNARGAIIENNHIHHFRKVNDDSHGIVVQTTSRNTTIRGNHIHHNSGDSIQCLGPEGFNDNVPADGLLIEGNDLHSDLEQGIDIKTCHNVVIRRNRLHHTRVNPGYGGNATMVIHMSARNVLVEENDFFDAGLAIGLGGNREGPMPKGVVIRRNAIHDMTTEGGMIGGGIKVENADAPQILNNTFTRLTGPALIVGGGTGGPTANLLVANNVFDARVVLKEGAQAPGLQFRSNLYAPDSQFHVRETPLDVTSWLAQGRDEGAVVEQPQLDPDTLFPGPAAVDVGTDLGLTYCGRAPDLGAVETGCPSTAEAAN